MTYDVKEEEQRARELYTNILIPYTWEYISEADLIGLYYDNQDLQFSSRYKSDFKGLVFSRRFENILAMRLENIQDILDELTPISVENAKIMATIKKELERNK